MEFFKKIAHYIHNGFEEDIYIYSDQKSDHEVIKKRFELLF